mmetsp:Transcript_28142/g.49060  ORF Transcript_28142/g.49060 Transcript_28142/m.49060 type:complete len:139 (+) Transcript_28142:254-670(+)
MDANANTLPPAAFKDLEVANLPSDLLLMRDSEPLLRNAGVLLVRISGDGLRSLFPGLSSLAFRKATAMEPDKEDDLSEELVGLWIGLLATDAAELLEGPLLSSDVAEVIEGRVLVVELTEGRGGKPEMELTVDRLFLL